MDRPLYTSILLVAIAVWPVGFAHADALNFSLTPATLSASAGGMVEFTGTLTNPGSNDVFLNGDVAVLPYSSLALDDSPFFIFSPLFLAGGETYTGPFFDVTVNAAALPGAYSGSFTIQGGPDSNTFDNLAVQDFEVDVVASAPIPEPGSIALVSSSAVLLALLRWKQRV
jgi:hypothetical protein